MYSGKTVLITGASRGIGAMLKQHFMENNAIVICPDRDVMDLKEPSEIESYLGSRLLKVDSGGKIDILINNAAVLTSHYATRLPLSGVEDMLKVDLLAPFLLSKGVIPLMARAPYGRIINISSMAVPLEPMGDSMYAACKAGMTKMANILAKEFAGFTITVNTIGISAIETDMVKQLNPEKIDKVIRALPLPRMATKEDIFNVIDFFASENSSYITSQTIYLGGVHT